MSDARAKLVARVREAGLDLARVVALARLNWPLIDAALIADLPEGAIRNAVARAASRRGEPETDVPAAVATHAISLLERRSPIDDIATAIAEATASERRLAVLPLVWCLGSSDGRAATAAVLAGAAAAFVDVAELARRFPDARLIDESFARPGAELTPEEPAVASPLRPAALIRELLDDEVRRALGGSLVWEDWRGDFRAAHRVLDGRAADPIAYALVLATAGDTGAALAWIDSLVASPELPVAVREVAHHVRRHASVLHIWGVPGGEVSGDPYLMSWGIAAKLDTPLPRGDSLGPRARHELETLELVTALATRRTYASYSRRRGDSLTADAAAAWRTPELAHEPIDMRPARSPMWALLANADLRRRAGDAAGAAEALSRASEAADATGDPQLEGEVWLVRGHWQAARVEPPLVLALCLEGSSGSDSSLAPAIERLEAERTSPDGFAAASACYDAAARAFERAGNRRGLAVVQLSRAATAALSGAHEAAAELARDAESRFDEIGDQRGRWLARTHAVIAASATGTPPLAPALTGLARWATREGSPAWAVGCARLVSRSGRRALRSEGDVERAVTLHQVAFELLAGMKLELLASQALVDQANALEAVAANEAAANLLEHASDRLAGPPELADSPIVDLRVMALANAIKLQIGSSHSGLERLIGKATALLEELRAGHSAVELARGNGRVLRWAVEVATLALAIARAERLAETPGASVRQLELAWASAFEAARALGDGERAMYELAVHAARGESAEAIMALDRFIDDEALESRFITDDLSPRQAAQSRAQLRAIREDQALAVCLRLRQPGRARALANRSLGEAEPDEPSWERRAMLAELRYQEGDHAAALAMYRQAIERIEARRSLLVADELKRSLLGAPSTQSVYVGAARAAFDREPERALELLEQGRARALADRLEARRPAHEGNAAVTRWRHAASRRARLRHLLASESAEPAPDESRMERLRAQLSAAERDATLLAATVGDRRVLDPKSTARSFEAIANHLPDGVLLLRYGEARDELLSWAVTRTGLVAHRRVAVGHARLRRLVAAFADACARGDSHVPPGQTLAELLIGRYEAELGRVQQVVIVPSSPLHAVPFHALPVRGGAVIDLVATSYAPSAGVIGQLGRGPLRAGPVLAIGDPTAMSLVDDAGTTCALDALPGARSEALRAAACFASGRALTGDDANLVEIAAHIAGASAVHLATHCTISERSPWLSRIALAHGASLDLEVLAELELAADLVTLSGCNTARGSVTGDDDPFGFARAMLMAGASRVVVAQWPVCDAATGQLMARFYERVASGEPPAFALRTAQRWLRDLPAASKDRLRDVVMTTIEPPVEGLAHPRYWAPFTLIGL